MISNLDFAYNTISSCLLSFFIIIDLHFLIPTAIARIFNPITELLITPARPIKEAKAEIEIHPVIAYAKISAQYNLEWYKHFSAF